MVHTRLRSMIGFLLFTIALLLNPRVYAVSPQSIATQRPGFPVILSGARIIFGSPTLADLNGDGKPEIIVGGSDGLLYAVRENGLVLWTFNVSNALNSAADSAGLAHSTKPISMRTAPAVANITGDSRPEVVVAAGDIFGTNTHGGVVVLSASGQLLPGWPRLALDVGGDGAALELPDGYADGVVSSPAIGDVDGDGQPEIVYGGFDQRVYARRADGSLVPGWPQFVLDTVWSSPALADLDSDGVLDVIVGVDAHNYNGPPRNTQDGGDLYAFKGNGSIIWRAHQDEIFQSSPAVADIDNDGRPEIVAGTGTYYSGPPFNRPVGRYLSAWNHDGTLAWRTPLPERVFGSPAIGDVSGDGKLDVVVGALDGKAYAFNGANGAILWATLARDTFNNQSIPNPQVYSPVLGDYDGDGRDDVFIAQGWDVVVIKGTNGVQFTATSPTDPNKPSFYGAYTILGTPAVGDLDGDGKLDLVSASGTTADPGKAQVNSWRLPNSTLKASWPQFRRNPAHTASFGGLASSTSQISSLIVAGDSRSFNIQISSSDGTPLAWTATETDPDNILAISPSNGTTPTTVKVTLSAPAAKGVYTASLRVASGAQVVTIPISVRSVDTVYDVFLPVTIH